ncbi:nucleotide-diphospho-sugar transferase [Camillea tinctor]|nr:nucleotide-diphospho-sugar transferase [Camillea tinctor]
MGPYFINIMSSPYLFLLPVFFSLFAYFYLRHAHRIPAGAMAISLNEQETGHAYDTTKIWTTLVSNRGYFGGLLVLNHSLRKTGSKYQLRVMVTRAVENDHEFMRAFAAAGIPTIVVDDIVPKPRENGKIKSGFWEKLAPWGLTEYERVVLLDSDQVILKNIDDMMEMEIPDGGIACAHVCACNPRKIPHYSKDWIPENCPFTAANQTTGEPVPITPESPEHHHLLNSGTVILQPSKKQFDTLIHTLNTHPDVPNMWLPDQELLAVVYRNRWRPLPYTYNALKPMRSCHANMWRDEDVRILHYILDKPWQSRYFDANDPVQSTHRLWWEFFAEVERDWLDGADDKKRALWENVVVPAVAQE